MRRHKRVTITGAATIKYVDKSKDISLHAMTVNISLGGIGLYCDELVEINTDVSVEINFISVDGMRTCGIEGRVVYTKNIGDVWFTGVQFDEDVDHDNQPCLYEHIQKILTWEM